MSKSFSTMAKAHSQDAGYWGERGHWFIVIARNRDSSILEQSNFAAATQMLGGEGEHVAIERSGHWAVGWVEYLIFDPAVTDLVLKAKELREQLESYPVLDEEDHSRREYEAYLEGWDSWGRDDYRRELVEWIDNNPVWVNALGKCDYTEADIVDCIRGELSDGDIDKLVQSARESVNWEYQPDGDGVSINIKGLTNRGGIAVWKSVNLSNPGASWSTPAQTDGQPTPKPTWQADDKPEIVTNPDEVTVTFDKEVARVRIALQRGHGLQIHLTGASSERVQKAVRKAGTGAYYQFDADEAVIYAPERAITLTEWARNQGLHF